MNFFAEKTEYSAIRLMREKYLQSIPYSQELFLEFKIRFGQYFLITEINNSVAGYIVTDSENVLLEFYVENKYLFFCEEVFDNIFSQLKIKSVYCKSFDSILLKCCFAKLNHYQLSGHLFRDYSGEPCSVTDLNMKPANSSDKSLLLSINDNFFENSEDLDYWLTENSLYIFTNPQGIIGCGLLHKINQFYDYYDLGMLVNPIFQKQGYGTKIVKSLVNYCQTNNWKPVCGCAAENIASRKTLEKAGFISKHSMIEFKT
ncbi:MAG: GNAT family N-acetyltransferase [Ignavibacteria bacterium]|nr:GNAT family N-acetyltransferase [Ignavibacteria bacterium]